MAERHWVGGSGTWNGTSNTHWSTSQGGSSGASAPAAGDVVYFNSGSGFTVTVENTIPEKCFISIEAECIIDFATNNVSPVVRTLITNTWNGNVMELRFNPNSTIHVYNDNLTSYDRRGEEEMFSLVGDNVILVGAPSVTFYTSFPPPPDDEWMTGRARLNGNRQNDDQDGTIVKNLHFLPGSKLLADIRMEQDWRAGTMFRANGNLIIESNINLAGGRGGYNGGSPTNDGSGIRANNLYANNVSITSGSYAWLYIENDSYLDNVVITNIRFPGPGMVYANNSVGMGVSGNVIISAPSGGGGGPSPVVKAWT